MPAANDSTRLSWCVLEYAKAVPRGAAAGAREQAGGIAIAGAGGALRIVGTDKVRLDHCRLRHNCAERGGAILVHYGAAPLLVNNLLHDNCGLERAGAIFVSYSYPRLVHNTLAGNRAVNPSTFVNTGGIDHYHSKPVYVGNVVHGNTTNHYESTQVLEPKAYYCALQPDRRLRRGRRARRRRSALLLGEPRAVRAGRVVALPRRGQRGGGGRLAAVAGPRGGAALAGTGAGPRGLRDSVDPTAVDVEPAPRAGVAARLAEPRQSAGDVDVRGAAGRAGRPGDPGSAGSSACGGCSPASWRPVATIWSGTAAMTGAGRVAHGDLRGPPASGVGDRITRESR